MSEEIFVVTLAVDLEITAQSEVDAAAKAGQAAAGIGFSFSHPGGFREDVKSSSRLTKVRRLSFDAS